MIAFDRGITRLAAGCARRATLAVLTLTVVLSAALGTSWPVVAQSSAEFSTRARNVILMDATTGAVLYQLRADERVSPASMSKLMTVTLVFKALKSGQLKASDEFVMSLNGWKNGGAPSGTSAMMVPLNQKARLDELLQGMVVQSGNDAAIAVAEGIAGSEAAFAKLMTEEGLRIGLKNSTFRNPTGLHDPEHLMTARDLALLARHIIREYPDYYPLFAQREFQYRKHKFINRNPLMGSPGVEGMKTGYIKQAGYGLVATASQDGRRLIAVAVGYDKAEERKTDTLKLLEWGFKGFTEHKVFEAGETIGQARVWGGSRMFLPLVGKGDVAILLPRFPANQKLKAEIVYTGPLKAPISKGDVVAHLRVSSTSGAVNEVPLVAGEDVTRSGVVRRGFDSLVHMALQLVPL